MLSLTKAWPPRGWNDMTLIKVMQSCDDIETHELGRWSVFIIKPAFSVASCHGKI